MSDEARSVDLSALPSIGSMMESEEGGKLTAIYGAKAVSGALSKSLSMLRSSGGVCSDKAGNAAKAMKMAADALEAGCEGLVRVINATGIVLHTNLGRAPLSKLAVKAALSAASGYSNLEYDLESGNRGSRQSHTSGLLSSLLGTEASMVVNNNAAAVLLCLDALAKGGKVAVSRGELVEIGGSFRVPEIISATGAVLLEVGTTNRTRASDFEKAAKEGAVAFLKVHPSNFRVTGFVAEIGVKELAEIANKYSIPLIYDIGSGSMLALEAFGLPHEPMPQEAIRDGADIVTFSGDKLFGGPQCGVIAGKRFLVDRISKSPLARAFRVDKMRLAAMSATLGQYRQEAGWQDIPALTMLKEPYEQIAQRAQRLITLIRNMEAKAEHPVEILLEAVDTLDEVGGGSVPGATLKGAGVKVSCKSVGAKEAASRLRHADVPAVALERGGSLLFALRTVSQEELEPLAHGIIEAFTKSVTK